jgi:acyl dehydratase
MPMEISPNLVGTRLKPHTARIHWRDTMNYAAAIFDGNPLYFDDEQDGGLVVHPMFSVAVTWPIVEHLPDYLDAAQIPPEVLLTQVHYSEHLIFHRQLRPDEKLTVNGQIVAVLPHRAGTQIVVRFQASDQDQQPVFTEFNGAILRGVQCRGAGQKAENFPLIPDDRDDRLLRWQKKITIDPLLPFIYDGCTNIVFPIHTSKKFAHQVGLPDIIVQGTATLALAVRELIKREAASRPLRLKEIYCRFSGMVLPGSDISLQVYGALAGPKSGRRYFDVLNQTGEKVLSHGYALFNPPAAD